MDASINDGSVFGQLFRQYRVLAGHPTLSEFADKLHELFGITIDTATLSRWQTGARLPVDRATMLMVLSLLCQSGVFSHLDQIQRLSASAGFGYLSRREQLQVGWDAPEQDVHERIKSQMEITSLVHCLQESWLEVKDEPLAQKAFLQSEQETLLYAAKRALEFKKSSLAIPTWNIIAPYLWDVGRIDVLAPLSEKMSALCRVEGNELEYAKITLQYRVWLKYWWGDMKGARSLLDDQAMAQMCKNSTSLHVLSSLRQAKILQAQNAVDESIVKLDSVLRLATSLDQDEMLGDALTYLGEAYWLKGNIHEAQKCIYRAEQHTVRIGDWRQYAIVQNLAAGVAVQKRDYAEARDRSRLSLDVEKRIGRNTGKYWNELLQAMILLQSGERYRCEAEALFTRANYSAHVYGLTSQSYKVGTYTRVFDRDFRLFGYTPSISQ